MLRRLLPLFALLLALAAPTLAEARASGGHPPGRSNVPVRSNTPRINRQVSGGGVVPVTPPPPPPPIPTVQQIRNTNAVLPAGTSSPPVATATQETSTAEPTRPNARPVTSSSHTPPFIVSAVVLILAAGSAATIVGFFAFCRSFQRRERERLRGLR
jgi:hypothetical protein